MKSEYEKMFLSNSGDAWGSSDQLRQLAERFGAWSGSDRLRQLAEQSKILGASVQLRQLAEQAKVWSGSEQLRQLAQQSKILGGSDQLGQLAEQARAWSGSEQLRQLAKQARALGGTDQLRRLGEQALTLGVTLDVVVGELVARSEKSSDLVPLQAGQEQAFQNLEFVKNPYVDERLFAPIKEQPLSLVPTWLLYLWLLVVLPLLTALASWDDLRASLVDINARIPQTTSFAQVRGFIRSELSGKPGDVRLVSNSNVRLRAAPSIKSEVLMELPKYAPVVVMGKYDRTWLFVSYEHDGFIIEGYISTKLLKKVRK